MSRRVSDLTTAFRKDVKTLREACKTKGAEMKPYFTLRTPEEQASTMEAIAK